MKPAYSSMSPSFGSTLTTVFSSFICPNRRLVWNSGFSMSCLPSVPAIIGAWQAAEIFAFVHALHQANRPDIYRKTNVPLGEDEFFKMCDDPHEIMLCAVRDGKILGLARTVMRGNAGDAVTLSRVRAVMEELAVLPQAQGMGIGTALLYASEAEAKRRGAESLELMVWSFNKSAMRFYESAGMTVRSFVMEKKL